MRGFRKMRGKDTCNLKGFSDVDYPASSGCVCSSRMRAAVLDSTTDERLKIRGYSAPCWLNPVVDLNASAPI